MTSNKLKCGQCHSCEGKIKEEGFVCANPGNLLLTDDGGCYISPSISKSDRVCEYFEMRDERKRKKA